MTGHYDFNGQPHFWKWLSITNLIICKPISEVEIGKTPNRRNIRMYDSTQIFARYTRHTRNGEIAHVNNGYCGSRSPQHDITKGLTGLQSNFATETRETPYGCRKSTLDSTNILTFTWTFWDRREARGETGNLLEQSQKLRTRRQRDPKSNPKPQPNKYLSKRAPIKSLTAFLPAPGAFAAAAVALIS